ncbi:MAG: sulfatase-like hydrolase/transferase [bacterium]|nr:sulfatase-like hydrolase/transferase [bacterium]
MKQNQSHFPWVPVIAVIAVIAAGVFYLLTRNTGEKLNANGMNLIVITLDTTRADRIGAYGYPTARTPNLDRLAKEGVMFEHCYSPVPVTLPSHSSIFTGQYPVGHGVRDNGAFFLDSSAVTLAEKMKELQPGYHTAAIIASFVLLSKFGLNQGFDRYDDSLKINEMINNFDSEITADQVYEKFNRWFETRKKEKDNFFAWVHFYDPHVPYAPPDRYKQQFDDNLEGLYNAELAFTDHYVGNIISDLEQAGMLENTLVIVTGDHGEAFGEHQEYGHALFCYQESIKVPLIFYNPRLFNGGMRVPHRVNLVDIMPTVLQMYGLDIPPGVQGKSFVNLLAGGKEKKERTFYAESMHGKEEMGWAPLTAIITGNYKFISLPEPELYDLSRDSGEKKNLFREKNRLARELDKQLMNLVRTCSTPVGSGKSQGDSQRQLTESDKAHLQTLGYISAFSGKTASNLDPKKGILLKNRFNRIEDQIDNDRLEEARSELEKMAEEDPEHLPPQYFGSLIRIYKQTGSPEQVIDTWEKAIVAFPQNQHFKINLAFEFFHMNRLTESETLADQILKENSKYTRAYILKSKIRERGLLMGEALRYLEEARQLEPENVSLTLSYARMLGKNRNFKKVAALCRELLANYSPSPPLDLKARIGVVLTEAHQDDAALELLTEVTGHDNAGAESWDYLGVLRFRKGQYPEAMAAYAKAIEKEPKSGKTYNNLGTLYLTLFLKSKDPGEHRRAIEAFDRALELDPDLASALNGRGSAYKFANRFPEAVSDWKRAIAVNPGFTEVYFNLGVTYLQMKAPKDALTYLNQCKEKFYHRLPPSARQRLDRLIRQAGG